MPSILDQNDPNPQKAPASLLDQNDPSPVTYDEHMRLLNERYRDPNADLPALPGQGETLQHMNPVVITPHKKQYGFWEALGQAPWHIAKSVADFYGNVGHVVGHPIESSEKLLNMLASIPGGIKNLAAGSTLNALTPEVRAQVIAQNPEALQPMADAANQVGNPLEKFANSIHDRWLSDPGEPWFSGVKRSIAEDPVGLAADAATGLTTAAGLGELALVPKLGRAGAKAAAAVATKPMNAVADLVNPLSTDNGLGLLAKGAANRLGVPLPTRDDLIQRAGAFTSPQNALVMGQTEGNAEAMQAALDSAPELVPGSKPNAAQALAGTPGTHFAAMQAPADALASTQAQALEQQQNAARVAQVNRIASDPAEFARAFKDPQQAMKGVEEAIKERDEEARANYALSNQVMMKADPSLMRMMNLPLTGSAF